MRLIAQTAEGPIDLGLKDATWLWLLRTLFTRAEAWQVVGAQPSPAAGGQPG